MHPEYLDYVVKRKVVSRAGWYDIKYLCKKLLGECPAMYVQQVVYGGWNGWLVEFHGDVDLAEIKRNVFGVLILGDRVVYIGVAYATT